MKSSWPGRLTAPAIAVIGGAGLALADGIAYGRTAGLSVAVVAVVAAIGYYIWGGRDSDTGAMIGRQVDERQRLLRMRAQSLALLAGTVVGLVGYMVAVARKDTVWPFVLILGVEAVAFVVGRAIYADRDAA